MYGLTDNIVAGPAGHITAGPAGHFEAGPSGSFTPAPGASTPVSGAGHVPISEGGHVPIDCTPALIPYAAHGGGIVFMEGSTQSPIPGPSAHVPVSQASGGSTGTGSGGVVYTLGGGGSLVGGGGFSGGGGIGGGSSSGGGISTGGISSGGGGSGGGGGASYLLGGGGSAAGSGGLMGGGGGSVTAATGSGVLYTSSSGPGMPPMELRVGQALSQATGSIPVSPATEGFTVSPGGRTVPTPTGYVHPPQASHFHGQPQTHVAHHPVRVDNNVATTEAYQGYHAAYVWQGRPEGAPPPPFLAGDYVKPSSYDPPRVVFADEAPKAIPLVDSTTSGPNMQVSEVVYQSLNQDLSQTSNVEYSSSTLNEKNISMDNSVTRNTTLSQPENREVNTSIDLSQTNNADLSTTRQQTTQVVVEDAARVLNMFFLDTPSASPADVTLGGPVMARVA